MNYRHFLSVLFCLLMVANVMAAPKDRPVTHLAAIAIANSVNRFETVENYLTWLGKNLPASDIEKFKAELSQYGITPEQKFPKMFYKNDKVYFDKSGSITVGEKITVNGKKFSVQQRPIHATFADICVQIKCPKPSKSADLSLFPKAYASFNWSQALLGAVAGGAATCLFSGPNCQNNWWKGALVAGGIAGFMNLENQYACGGNCGPITCQGGDYYMNTNQPYYGNQSISGRQRISANTTSGSYPYHGTPPPCGTSPQYNNELQADLYSNNPGFTDWAQAPLPQYPLAPADADAARAAASEPKKGKK